MNGFDLTDLKSAIEKAVYDALWKFQKNYSEFETEKFKKEDLENDKE